jgi:hypothetical protein
VAHLEQENRHSSLPHTIICLQNESQLAAILFQGQSTDAVEETRSFHDEPLGGEQATDNVMEESNSDAAAVAVAQPPLPLRAAENGQNYAAEDSEMAESNAKLDGFSLQPNPYRKQLPNGLPLNGPGQFPRLPPGVLHRMGMGGRLRPGVMMRRPGLLQHPFTQEDAFVRRKHGLTLPGGGSRARIPPRGIPEDLRAQLQGSSVRNLNLVKVTLTIFQDW